MNRIWFFLTALSVQALLSACTTVPSKALTNEVVRISLKEVYPHSNTVYYLVPNSGGKYTKKVVHPEASLLMFTLDDGLYHLVPKDIRVPYYHGSLGKEYKFLILNMEGKIVGECAPKLEELVPVPLYREHCTYTTGGVSIDASVATKRHPEGTVFLSMYGNLRVNGALKLFRAD